MKKLIYKCRHKAFTLIELIITITIITLIASIVIIVINPQSIFINLRNTQRNNDLSLFKTSIQKYLLDYPTSVTNTQRSISNFTGYDALLTSATSANPYGDCPDGTNGTNLNVVRGAYDINTTGSNILNPQVLIDNGYISKIMLEPLTSSPYKACIDTINNNNLILYTLQNEISTVNNYLVVQSFSPTPQVLSGVWHPNLVTPWQIQYTGTLSVISGVQMYALQLFTYNATHVTTLHNAGAKVLCDFSGGSWESWTPDQASFPASVKGNTIVSGEKYVDIRRIDLLASIMQSRLDTCKSQGFDGVVMNNVDGYTNSSGFPLTSNDQKLYNTFLVNEAHARGLAVSLFDDGGQVSTLNNIYDMSMTEDCYVYSECNLYRTFVNNNKPVFDYEDTGAPATLPLASCNQLNSYNFNGILKNSNLNAANTQCR